MSEQTIENMDVKSETMEADKYSISYCLEQIERIGHQTEYLNQVITELRQMGSGSACEAQAMALGNIVECRETTNQQMLRFYENLIILNSL